MPSPHLDHHPGARVAARRLGRDARLDELGRTHQPVARDPLDDLLDECGVLIARITRFSRRPPLPMPADSVPARSGSGWCARAPCRAARRLRHLDHPHLAAAHRHLKHAISFDWTVAGQGLFSALRDRYSDTPPATRNRQPASVKRSAPPSGRPGSPPRRGWTAPSRVQLTGELGDELAPRVSREVPARSGARDEPLVQGAHQDPQPPSIVGCREDEEASGVEDPHELVERLSVPGRARAGWS